MKISVKKWLNANRSIPYSSNPILVNIRDANFSKINKRLSAKNITNNVNDNALLGAAPLIPILVGLTGIAGSAISYFLASNDPTSINKTQYKVIAQITDEHAFHNKLITDSTTKLMSSFNFQNTIDSASKNLININLDNIELTDSKVDIKMNQTVLEFLKNVDNVNMITSTVIDILQKQIENITANLKTIDVFKSSSNSANTTDSNIISGAVDSFLNNDVTTQMENSATIEKKIEVKITKTNELVKKILTHSDTEINIQKIIKNNVYTEMNLNVNSVNIKNSTIYINLQQAITSVLDSIFTKSHMSSILSKINQESDITFKYENIKNSETITDTVHKNDKKTETITSILNSTSLIFITIFFILFSYLAIK